MPGFNLSRVIKYLNLGFPFFRYSKMLGYYLTYAMNASFHIFPSSSHS